MKAIALFIACIFTTVVLRAQPAAISNISEERARQHLQWLSADSMRGRANGSYENWQVAEYIADLYQKSGLVPLPGFASFYHPFRLDESYNVPLPVLINWGGMEPKKQDVRWFGPFPLGRPDDAKNNIVILHTDSAFHSNTLLRNWPGDGDIILWTEKRPKKKKHYFPSKFEMPIGGLKRNILLLYADFAPESVDLSYNPEYLSKVGHNVVGMLPGGGTDRIHLAIGAHYDHVGLSGKGDDMIMNGANDNASGTTALLLLAEYFGRHPVPGKNLVFMAFAGEEIGLYGSIALSKDPLLPPINKMLNLEMLGIPQFGPKTVFITGQGLSDFSRRLDRELTEAGLKIIQEPAEERMLYKRSDNFSFVERGVPAHTVMASDDLDPCYHRPCDEAGRINIDNLTAIARAIAAAVRSMLGD
ncbi:MAG: M28 family peptidase [Chitinophagaceae bacterium]